MSNSEPVYVSTVHHLVKVLADGKVSFPIEKTELLRKVSSLKVKTDFDVYTPIGEIIKDIQLDYFECAAAFYNALTACLCADM